VCVEVVVRGVVYVVVVGYKKCVLRTWSEEWFMLLLYKNCVLRTWSEEWFMLLWLVIRIVC
jgi:hypothetical protein